MVREGEESEVGRRNKGGKGKSEWKQEVNTGLTGRLHTDRMVCGLPKHGLYSSQSDTDVMIT